MSDKDDRRMREMADRLMAMSPDAPPFPEETVTASPKRTARRNPILVFAGAVVAVLVAGVIPFLLTRSNDVTVGTSVPEPTETTVPVATSLPVDTTTPVETTVPIGVWEHVIYLAQTPANSLDGNPALVPLMTELPGTAEDDLVLAAHRSLSLLTNPDLRVPDGFDNLIPEGVEVMDVTDSGDGYLIVDMNEAFLDGAGGLLGDITMLNQLVYTATHFGRQEGVLFTVRGEHIEAYGTDGLVLTEPVGRDDFLDHLNSVIITEPLIYGGDGLAMVAGVANVFEATVSLQIVETESGEVLYEDFTTATCGTGCWGEFAFDLDVAQLRPERTVLVFWHSPKDGAPTDVVRIPINPETAWDLAP